jgi:hypothetical protein
MITSGQTIIFHEGTGNPMNISSMARYAFGISAGAAILAGCSSGLSQVAPAGVAMGTNTRGGVVDSLQYVTRQSSNYASLIPEGMRLRGPMPLVGRPAPDIAKRGIYASGTNGTSILGYKQRNRLNNPPFCTTPFSVSTPYGIAVDGAGNLITGNLASRSPETYSIIIGQGPNMCGAMAATISDPNGHPRDFSSANALTGTIAVANDAVRDQGASIALCTVSGGCTVSLTNPAMHRVFAVAMDNSGNCWGDGTDASYTVTLTYFAGCTGSGVQATGFINVNFGGIDIDASGNLVTIDLTSTGGTGAVNVYSGCNPTCTLLSSTPTIANSEYGHLSRLHNKLAVSDVQNNQIDIYRYSPTGVTYLYSFNNGLPASIGVVGVAYNKRSSQ